MKKLFFVILMSASVLYAGVRLPIHTLRSQAQTQHCWAYAMSFLFEARALDSRAVEMQLDTEVDVKYWVDYERMMHIHRTKGDFYLGYDNEGGWQIEYWNSLIKHGKPVRRSLITKAETLYKPFEIFKGSIGFLPAPPWHAKHDLGIEELKDKLRKFSTEKEASDFAMAYLNDWYGQPLTTTEWMGQTIAMKDSVPYITGNAQNSTDDFILIKPVVDGDFGWVKYLNDRYWGYRYDARKVLELVESSLDQAWPVTFDNVYHAMTILGYEKDPYTQDTHYAVIDSAYENISWYNSEQMLRNLNLVTFRKETIQNKLPKKPSFWTFRNGFYDKLDGLTIPPR